MSESPPYQRHPYTDAMPGKDIHKKERLAELFEHIIHLSCSLESPFRLSPEELADQFIGTKSTISRHIGDLKKAGFIETCKIKNKNHVSVTNKGHTLWMDKEIEMHSYTEYREKLYKRNFIS